jgi:hypothetical protein
MFEIILNGKVVQTFETENEAYAMCDEYSFAYGSPCYVRKKGE